MKYEVVWRSFKVDNTFVLAIICSLAEAKNMVFSLTTFELHLFQQQFDFSLCPSTDATNNAEFLFSLIMFYSHYYSSNISTISQCPSPDVTNNADAPCPLIMFVSHSCFRKSLTISVCPLADATHNAELIYWFAMFGSPIVV